MRFKEWLKLDEVRFKGLRRAFDNQFPDLPSYVANDIYNNRIAYTFGKKTNPQDNRMAPTAGSESGPSNGFSRSPASATPSNLPSRIFNNSSVNGVTWGKEPEVIKLSPLSFTEQTLHMMIQRRFGFENDPKIQNDAARMQKQRELAMQRSTKENEPIILVRNSDGKYDLLEGWHRAMTYLVFDHNDQIGAPPDQIQVLASGDLRRLDLSRWVPVPIKAYVGVRQETPNVNSRPAPTSVQSPIGAASAFA